MASLPRLRAIDLCCGAGGWEVAARGLPIDFLAAVDWAEDCCRTVRYNHRGLPVACADVATLNLTPWRGRVDLVLGAIPCEEISVTRCAQPASQEAMAKWHRLLDSMLEQIRLLEPRWWAVENVTTMAKHLPPLVPQVVLDAVHWSGQRRKRLFCGAFPVPPRRVPDKVLLDYLDDGPYTLSKSALRAGVKTRRVWYGQGTKRVMDLRRASPTITDFGSRQVNGFIVDLGDGRERELQFVEAARLQGFPNDYVFVASRSRAFKLVAQAVQIDAARAILEGIVQAHAAQPRREGAA